MINVLELPPIIFYGGVGGYFCVFAQVKLYIWFGFPSGFLT
jgi:hypothetical protein